MTSLLDLTWLVQIGILVSCWAWRVWWCCNRFPPLFPLSQLMVTPVGMLVMLFWFWWILYGSSSSAHPKFLTLFVRHAHWMHCCEVIISPTIAFWRIVAPKWRSLMYFSCHPLYKQEVSVWWTGKFRIAHVAMSSFDDLSENSLFDWRILWMIHTVHSIWLTQGIKSVLITFSACISNRDA